MSCAKARQAITEVYNLKEVDECICKMVRADHRADFKQELFLILLQTPCDRVEDIAGKGELKYYAVRIILNLARQKRNVYHTTYLGGLTEYDPNKEPAEEEDHTRERLIEENKEQMILTQLNNMDEAMGTFYHRELVSLVARLGSMGKASRQLGIPKSSIKYSIKKVRDYLNRVI